MIRFSEMQEGKPMIVYGEYVKALEEFYEWVLDEGWTINVRDRQPFADKAISLGLRKRSYDE